MYEKTFFLVIALCPCIMASTYSGHAQGYLVWPSDIPPTATYIVLSGNSLITIPAEVLDDFPSLQHLSVPGNDITLADRGGVLKIGAALEYLSISFNRLTSFHLQLLESANDVSSLDEIYLNSNELTSFPEFDVEISTTIEYMNLRGNMLTSIPEQSLTNFINLNFLNLQSNQIAQFPSVDPDASIGQSLLTLRLDSNRLTIITTSDMAPFTNLEKLYVNDNLMTSIQEFPMPTRIQADFLLDVSNNPFYCDENIMWLKTVVPSTSLSISDPPCASPPVLVTESWANINIPQGEYCYNDSLIFMWLHLYLDMREYNTREHYNIAFSKL